MKKRDSQRSQKSLAVACLENIFLGAECFPSPEDTVQQPALKGLQWRVQDHCQELLQFQNLNPRQRLYQVVKQTRC
eukprot:1088717-Ditylum_brightwellii.AAC.1